MVVPSAELPNLLSAKCLELKTKNCAVRTRNTKLDLLLTFCYKTITILGISSQNYFSSPVQGSSSSVVLLKVSYFVFTVAICSVAIISANSLNKSLAHICLSVANVLENRDYHSSSALIKDVLCRLIHLRNKYVQLPNSPYTLLHLFTLLHPTTMDQLLPYKYTSYRRQNNNIILYIYIVR